MTTGTGGTSRVLFGLHVEALTLIESVHLADRALHERQRLMIGVLNAAKVVKMRADGTLRDSLVACDALLADGQSVVWASRLLGRPLPERVAGIDLFEHLLALADLEGRRVFLLGARPDVLRDLESVLAQRFPGVVLAGSHDGYFDDTAASAVADEIATSDADLLFLGMPTPRKENFLASHAVSLDVPVLHGVGGSFDVLAGRTRRAPTTLQRVGLEWAYRVLQEPSRLWRRYLVTNTAFLVILLRERLRPQPPYRSESPLDRCPPPSRGT